MKMIIAVTFGTDDPTRATLGMVAAKVAVDQGMMRSYGFRAKPRRSRTKMCTTRSRISTCR